MRVFESPPLPCLPPSLSSPWNISVRIWFSSDARPSQREFLDVCTRIKRMIVRSTFARVVEMIWKLAVGSTLWNIGLHSSFFRLVLNVLFLSFFWFFFYRLIVLMSCRWRKWLFFRSGIGKIRIIFRFVEKVLTSSYEISSIKFIYNRTS